MAETQNATEKKTQNQPKPASRKETKQTPKREEYVKFRELTKEQIENLDTVIVKLERKETPYGVQIQLIVEFDDFFKKVIRNPKMIDERKYNLILLHRKDLDNKDSLHVLELPVRFFIRHDADGNIKYRRFEVSFTRNIVISDFFDFTDVDLIEALDFNWVFKEDKDSSKELSYSKEVEYSYFE